MKKFSIFLICLVSSFIFAINTKADDNTCPSDAYCFGFSGNNVNFAMSDSLVLSDIETFRNMFNSQNTYEHYFIFFNSDTTNHSGNGYYLTMIMYNGNLRISHASKNYSLYAYFDSNMQYSYVHRAYYNFFSSSRYNNNIYNSNYTDVRYSLYDTTVLKNQGFNINEINSYIYFLPIESNYDILYKQLNSPTEKYYFLDEERYINVDDTFPMYYSSTPVPEISFTTQSYTANNSVYKVDLTIDYGIIDNEKYIYLYSLDEGDNWTSVYLTNNTSYTLPIEKNSHVIARVLDKETYEPIDTKTHTISNIETYADISFSSETLKDDYNNIYQTNVTINYDTQNRNLYDYQYTTDNYILEGQQFWVSLDSDESSTTIQSRQNINIVARVVDNDSGAVIKTETYTIVQNIDKPKISFKAFENYEYNQYDCSIGVTGVIPSTCGENHITSVDLTIDFALVDNDKYAYMYKTVDSDGVESEWTTVYLLNRSIDVNFNQNLHVVAQVYDKENDEIVTTSTYTITSVYAGSSVESTKTFIGQMSSILTQFMSLIDYLFNGLHPIIRTSIITLFTLLMLSIIIRLIRRR